MTTLLKPRPTSPAASSAPTGPNRAQRLFLLEFNELCPTLLDQFMAEGQLPNFRRFHDQSTVFTTDAGEPASHLEPWIQWPSVHTGLPAAKHGCYHLGDGRAMTARGVAELLSEANVPVGVCGSMNTNYGSLNGYVLPDPWDARSTAWPAELDVYARVVGGLVRDSSRERLGLTDLARLAWFLLRRGLSSTTVRMAIAQLADERRDRGVNWRRACVLDRIQFDLFRHLNRRHGVRFATLFCNSTAHFQHYYWRHMAPDLFDVPPSAGDHQSLAGAIVHGYRSMDRLLGDLMADAPDARLILCTALSQQPWTDATKCTYRPRNFDRLLEFAGCPVGGEHVEPVMAEQFHIHCGGAQLARTTEVLLNDLMLDDGQSLMLVKRTGDKLFCGCAITTPNLGERQVLRRSTGATQPFSTLFHQIHTMRSGRHHPDGVLWIRDGEHRRVTEKVPLTAIAPTILSHFGVPIPAEMASPPLQLARVAA